jgi:hypothetical protein
VSQLTILPAAPEVKPQPRRRRPPIVTRLEREACRDCHTRPRLDLWRVCEPCWRQNRAHDAVASLAA